MVPEIHCTLQVKQTPSDPLGQKALARKLPLDERLGGKPKPKPEGPGEWGTMGVNGQNGQMNSWVHGTTRRASFTPASITFPVLLSFEGLLVTIRPFFFFADLTFNRVNFSLCRFRPRDQD